MSAESEEGQLPTSKASADSWDADDTPRLDEYFRGKVWEVAPPSGWMVLHHVPSTVSGYVVMSCSRQTATVVSQIS